MMVVEEILRIPPRNRLSKLLHPMSCPIVAPTPIIESMVSDVATTGRMPILAIFLSENSSPSTNMRNDDPNFASTPRCCYDLAPRAYRACVGLPKRPATM